MLQSLFSWNHVHPALVHFTVASVPVSLVTDLIGRFTGRGSATAAAWWMVLYGAIATPFTAMAGWMWASDIPGNSGVLSTHRWLGLSLAILIPALGAWRGSIFARSNTPGPLYLVVAILICVLLMYQGFIGGEMTVG